MKFSRSASDIASAEQSPTPHSAPRMQYLSWICRRFLQFHTIAISSSCALQFSKTRWLCKAAHGRSFAYLSLFCLDFSSSSFKTGDDLNLASLSAYFFWFASAPSRTTCKSVNITRQLNTAMESEAKLESLPFNFFRNSISGSFGPGTDSSPENPDMIPASAAGKSLVNLDDFDRINFWAIQWINGRVLFTWIYMEEYRHGGS